MWKVIQMSNIFSFLHTTANACIKRTKSKIRVELIFQWVSLPYFLLVKYATFSVKAINKKNNSSSPVFTTVTVCKHVPWSYKCWLSSLLVWHLSTSIWTWRLKRQVSVYIYMDVLDTAAYLVSAVEWRVYSVHYKVILHRIWTDA